MARRTFRPTGLATLEVAMVTWVLLGCAPEIESLEDAGGVLEEDRRDLDDARLEGTVKAGEGLSATVAVTRSFAAIADDVLIVYASSTPGATCEAAAEALQESDEDPSGVFTEGTCNVLLLVGGYTGSLAVEDDLMTAVSSNLSCAMGDGDWIRDEQTGGWAWTGTWWQGFPTDYRWVFEGADPTELTLDIEMTNYDGSFPYSLEIHAPAPASGVVAGTLLPEDCPGLLDWWD